MTTDLIKSMIRGVVKATYPDGLRIEINKPDEKVLLLSGITVITEWDFEQATQIVNDLLGNGDTLAGN